MEAKQISRLLLLLAFLTGTLARSVIVQAAGPASPVKQSGSVSAYDLILATNTLRVSNGLPALVEDPIVNAIAQRTAEIMAANEMSWHIGDVRGRLKAAGYGGGATVWATENFAVGRDNTIDEIMLLWSDPTHSIPVVNPAYCNVGAGVAKAANGSTYYILQAAYTSEHACGEYKSVVGGSGTGSGSTGGDAGQVSVPQIIFPVKVATPDADGKIYHEVQNGQSFWSIAIAYKITIKDIEFWNNISRETDLLVGQRLFIPGKNTEGYATPTPVGMVEVSQPDQDGRVVHTVREYQTLYTISTAYKVDVQRIVGLNGLQIDWPLQIGQKLLIDPGFVTPSPTPRPLTPIEKLTPASDGRYYHTVQSGETISWIAGLYEVNMYDLMAWNGLTDASIIRPDQKLLLQVTPPATETPTPGPPTHTPTATQSPPTVTATRADTPASIPTEQADEQGAGNSPSPAILYTSLGFLVIGLFVVVFFIRRN